MPMQKTCICQRTWSSQADQNMDGSIDLLKSHQAAKHGDFLFVGDVGRFGNLHIALRACLQNAPLPPASAFHTSA